MEKDFDAWLYFIGPGGVNSQICTGIYRRRTELLTAPLIVIFSLHAFTLNFSDGTVTVWLS